MTHDETSYRARPIIASIILLGGSFILILAMAVSVSLGATHIALIDVWNAIFHFDTDVTNHQIIQNLRLPRVIGGAIVGACFAVSGAVMQGMTRNPLADSGLLGLNAGAAFMLAICLAFFPGMAFHQIILFCFVGAGIGAVLVFGVGSLARGGMTPVRLVLAGAAVSALLTALSEGIAITKKVAQDMAFWIAGGMVGTGWTQVKMVLPWFILTLIAAIMLSRSITLLSLGEEVAVGLGQRTGWIKFAGMVIVLIMAGSAVSIVGAVGFVGLIIPHITRYLVGVDYRWIIPCSAVLGALLMVLADLGARMVNPPEETPVGALIALIGVPFFLYLARKNRREL